MLQRLEHMTPSGFQDLLDEFPRVALAGVVRSGKSLLLDGVFQERLFFHTDSLQRAGLAFREYPAVVLELLGRVSRFVVAGMQVPRILRKGLEVDVVVWLNTPLGSLTPKQLSFSKGARTIFHTWRRAHPEVPAYFVGRAEHDDVRA